MAAVSFQPAAAAKILGEKRPSIVKFVVYDHDVLSKNDKLCQVVIDLETYFHDGSP